MNNIVIFLNGQRGFLAIESLLKKGHQISCVVAPDNKDVSNIDKLCESKAIRLLRKTNVNEDNFINLMKEIRPEIFIIAGFSKIFKRPLIEVPRLGTINLHAGRVPYYRGGSPLNWQIIRGENKIGVSILRVTEGIDNGSVLAAGEFHLGDRETIDEVHVRANHLFSALLIKTIEKLTINPAYRGEVQDENLAQYWHQRSDEDGFINPILMSASSVDRMVRALTYPYPGAFIKIRCEVVRIFQVSIPSFNIKGTPGRICMIDGSGPYMICADRAVILERYQAEGDKFSRLTHGQYARL